MSNDRLLSRLHVKRELALRDGDTLHAAEYEKRINELLEEDRLKVMDRMGAMKMPMPKDCFLRDINGN